jgi:hypothetical protein
MYGNSYHLVVGRRAVGPLGGDHIGGALMLVQPGQVNGTEMTQC